MKPKAASGGAKNPPRSTPRPRTKCKSNFTDAEAKVMKQSNKGFDYSYNAQAVVDIAEQIIVAAETTNEANDKQQAVPMAQAALDNLNAAAIQQPKAADGTPTPIPNTADTGYFSKDPAPGARRPRRPRPSRSCHPSGAPAGRRSFHRAERGSAECGPPTRHGPLPDPAG